MGTSREEATAQKRRRAVQPVDRSPASNAQSAREAETGLRALHQAAVADRTTRSGVPLTAAGVLAMQRTAGNRATCQVIKVQRLQHPDFPKPADKMSNIELLKAYQFDVEGDIFGHGLPPKDSVAVQTEMKKRKLTANLESPLKQGAWYQPREFFPTRKGVAVEAAKPAIAVGAGLAGKFGAEKLSTASGAISPGGDPHHLGPITLGGATSAQTAVGAEVFGGLLLADAIYGLKNAKKAMTESAKRGDTAGHKLGAKKFQQQSWGVAGGATATASGGIKLGAALGSTAAGLAAAAGGLGVVGGALTAAQGSWKIYLAGKKINDLNAITPLTAKGKEWKEYVRGREKRKAGINALKVALGALGIAAGALLITSNPVGWAVGVAAMLAGGIYAGAKVGTKIADVSKRRSAKKIAEAGQGKVSTLDPLAAKPEILEQMKDDPARREQAHKLADKVAQENSDNAKYAAAMIAALGRAGAEKKIATMVETRDREFSFDKDFEETREVLREERNLVISEEDLEWHDAQVVLKVLNVPPYMALAESGQDLIQKKLSVAEAS